MKKLLLLAGLIFIGTAGWSVGSTMSSDALSMAVGILLGVLAGLPTALLVLSSARRREGGLREQPSTAQHRHQPYGHLPPGYGQPQPPMIVFAGQQPPQMPSQGGHPAADYSAMGYPVRQEEAWLAPRASERRFRLVGEEDGFVE